MVASSKTGPSRVIARMNERARLIHEFETRYGRWTRKEG
jgi:hypothetical protein